MSVPALKLSQPALDPLASQHSAPLSAGISTWTRMVLRLLSAGLTPEDLEKMSPEELSMRLWHCPQPPD